MLVPRVDEEQIARMVNGDFTLFSNLLTERRKKLYDFLMHYMNTPQKKSGDALFNVSVPLATENVDVLVGELVDKVIGPDGLNTDIGGRTYVDENQARAIRKLMSYQQYRVGMKEKIRSIILDCVIYGVSPVKVYYDEQHEWMPIDSKLIEEAGEVASRPIESFELVYRGPNITKVDVFNWYPHPDMASENDNLPIIEDAVLDYEALIEGRDSDAYINVDELLSKLENLGVNPDTGRLHAGADLDNDEYKTKRRAMVGIKSPGDISVGVKVHEWQGPYDIDHDHRREKCIFTVTADNTVIQAEELPYHDRRSSYVVFKLFPVPGEIWAQGMIEKAHQSYHIANMLMSNMLTHVAINLHPPTLIDKDRVFNSQLLGVPGGLVKIKVESGRALNSYIQPLSPQQLSGDVYQIYEYNRENVQIASGGDDIRSGRIPGRGQQTAKAVGIANTQSSVRLQSVIEVVESSGIIPMTTRWHRINRQFIRKAEAIMIIGKDGNWWPEEIDPAQLAADVDFIATGSTKELNRGRKVEELAMVYNLASQSPVGQAISVPLLVRMMELMKIDNMEEIKQLLEWEQFKLQQYEAYMMSIGEYPVGNTGRPVGGPMPRGGVQSDDPVGLPLGQSSGPGPLRELPGNTGTGSEVNRQPVQTGGGF